VINFVDGFDIYNIESGELVKSIPCPQGELYMAGVAFVDEETLATGLSRGPVAIFHCGPNINVEVVLIDAVELDRESVLWL
jgi:hypothetical protein